MAAIESNSQAESGPSRVGPGLLLRKARENAGVSLHDVAAQLHLDARTIASLERDAFDELPAPTFVRGYLRGYARLLNLPVGPIMEAYDREGFHPPDLVADIAEKPQAQSGDLPVRMLTYLIVVVLAALVVWWWYDREAGSPPRLAGEGAIDYELPDPAVSRPAAPGDDEIPTSDASPSAGTGSKNQELAADAPTPEGSVTRAQPTLQPGGEEAAALTPLDINKRVEDELAKVERSLAETSSESATAAVPIVTLPQAQPTEPAASGVDESDAAASQDAVPEPQAADVPAEANLRLEFPIEAWVEIYDRNGGKLFFNLVKPGRVLDLSGETPIRVLLGRSKGVELQFNGEPVDLDPHVRKGGVAQLTLGR